MIDVRAARALVHGPGEVAFLDLRESAPFSEGHPLFATPLDFGLLEEQIGALVPRTDTPVLLIDADGGVAKVAKNMLDAMGYTDVRPVDGGIAAWEAAGFPLYAGVHVPSKTLGELAELAFAPALIGPDQLAQRLAAGERLHFFDVRPPNEHRKMRIPGARCLPNGETAHRLAVFRDDVPIVLTCAGRTRGLIGAASLGLVAPERRVVALEDGTQGWVLAGRDLERGAQPDPFPALDERATGESRARAEAFAKARDIRVLDGEGVADLARDRDRTIYLFDVRSPEEAAMDPLPAFGNAPCGQLVQGTDRWIATRRARVVLACDTGLRSALAAFWLRCLGFETAAVRIDSTLRAIPTPNLPGPGPGRAPSLDPVQAIERAATGGRFVDVRTSRDWDSAHLDGSRWTTRSALATSPPSDALMLIGDATLRAELAWRSLPNSARSRAALVEGGLPALENQGARIARNALMPVSTAVDRVSFAAGRHDGNHDASRRYLRWEKGLVATLDHEERGQFGLSDDQAGEARRP